MTVDTPESLKGIDRTTPVVSRLLNGATGTGDGGRAGAFAKLLNAQRTEAPAPATRPATGKAFSPKKGTPNPLESAAFQLNHQDNTDEADARHAEVEKAAEGLVSNALILPILKQVRRSMESANSVFSGGNGEKTFGPEFDMQLADRIAKSPQLGVRDALVKRMEKRNGSQAKTTQPKTPTLDIHG